VDGFYSNYTACIGSNNRTAIAEAIINLLELEEGVNLLPQLPDLKIDLKKLRQSLIWERPNLLIVGLGIGQNNYTILKTYPNEWFSLFAPGSDRSRLSALAIKLKCDAFYYQVVRDFDLFLLEADSKGNTRIDRSDYPQFSLINVPEAFHQIIQTNNSQELIELREQYANLFQEIPVNLELAKTFSKEAKMGEAEYIDVALSKLLDTSGRYWQNNDFFYKIYAHFQQLEQMNVKLLHFNLPRNYLKTLPVYQISDDDFGNE
jgi:hypothetical protein